MEIDECALADCEKSYLMQMIMDTNILREVRPALVPDLFATKPARIIVKWLIEYYDKEKTAPEKGIVSIYHRKSDSLTEREREDIIDYLKSLPDAYKVNNVDYVSNNIIKYLKCKQLNKIGETLVQYSKRGMAKEGDILIKGFSPLDKVNSGVDDITQVELAQDITDAFSVDEGERLFKFPGALGEALGWIQRGDLNLVAAPPKGGKSFHLLFTANIAANRGLNVIYFNFEITRTQMLRRLWTSAFGIARTADEITRTKFKRNGDKWDIIDEPFTPKTYDENLVRKLQDKLRLVNPTQVKTVTYNRGGRLGIREIKAELEHLLIYEHWQPDVVIVDFMDIIEPERHYDDVLERDNYISEELAGLASKLNCAVFTATQGNRNAMRGKAYSTADGLGGSYRKISSVGRFYTIFASKAERERGITHIQLQDLRDSNGKYEPVTVLQCLDIGKWYTDSRFDSEVTGKNKSYDSDDDGKMSY